MLLLLMMLMPLVSISIVHIFLPRPRQGRALQRELPEAVPHPFLQPMDAPAPDEAALVPTLLVAGVSWVDTVLSRLASVRLSLQIRTWLQVWKWQWKH
jgi:hypothetical protein